MLSDDGNRMTLWLIGAFHNSFFFCKSLDDFVTVTNAASSQKKTRYHVHKKMIKDFFVCVNENLFCQQQIRCLSVSPHINVQVSVHFTVT